MMRRLAVVFSALLITGAVSPAPAQPGDWVEVERMALPRERHTATLLPNGHVLVVGGSANGVPLEDAELYDAATGRWIAAAPPLAGRRGHSATLLPDGTVLVVGGFNDTLGFSEALASAEIYDPRRGTWSSTGSLAEGREDHTATLLVNGEVLVVGGRRYVTRLASAEIYDPAQGIWRPAGNLAAARYQHTATRLATGKVLVAGGKDDDVLAGVEVYDPKSGSWSASSPLAAARSEHTASLLPDGKVLVAGGNQRTTPLAACELYDPATGLWSATGALAAPRWDHFAALLADGRILVGGGYKSTVGGELDSSELYDPATGTWSSGGLLHSARRSPAAVLLPSGDVLVAGGSTSHSLASAEVWAPAGGAWESQDPLSVRRDDPTATVLPTGEVLVAGGYDGFSYLAETEAFDPAGGTWRSTAPLAAARRRHSATLLPGGKVLVAGGDAGASLGSAELYDSAADAWSPAGSLSSPREEHTATLLASGKVLFAGGVQDAGSTRRFLTSAELYDVEAGVFVPTGSLERAHSGHTAVLLEDGRVLAIGGDDGHGEMASVEIYDPETGLWSPAGSLESPREGHTSTLLPGGRILVTGGFRTTHLASTELYDPVRGTWEPTGPLATARSGHTSVLLASGKVLVVGGSDGSARPLTSAELYDPAGGDFRPAGDVVTGRTGARATLLDTGDVLLTGGYNFFEGGEQATVDLYRPADYSGRRRPALTSQPQPLVYGGMSTVEGTGLTGDADAGDGQSHSSASVNYPLLHLQSVENGQISWLPYDELTSFSGDPLTLTVSDLPSGIEPGWYYLRAVTAGVPSVAKTLEAVCSIAITRPPADVTVSLGDPATFTVESQGGRRWQWQICRTEICEPQDWLDIPGATASSYTVPVAGAADAGSAFRVEVGSGCTSRTSEPAVLRVADSGPPAAEVLSPRGGEYWLLSDEGAEPRTERITWEMSDDIRICRVEVSLWYSNDGGASFREAPAGGGLPFASGSETVCPHPGEETRSIVYTVPVLAPSGTQGSLYKVELRVTDHAGRLTAVRSRNPFFIVRSAPDSVRTLILTHLGRMRAVAGVTEAEAADLATHLGDLAHHPRVRGLVVDLGLVPSLTALYAAWNADRSNPARANEVLFAAGGLHDYLGRELLATYTSVESLVLVGDDRIVPMARIQDRTVLFPEERYPEPLAADLTPDGTTVGEALAANKYLSDDPLAVLDPIHPDELNGSLFIPDLAVGRLVETPPEIVTTIAAYISRDGVLDLSGVAGSHKVQVTGYDFLRDSAVKIREHWGSVLGQTPQDTLAPVDGELVGQSWDDQDLRQHLCGNGGASYGLVSLNGHAVHYAEGVPGSDPFDIRGLAAADLAEAAACGSGPLDLTGNVLYAVGCHGGLPVAGSDPADADHSLDLPQTFLSRGAVAYVANSGYGWGLRHGIGYSERLVQLFTEEMSRGGTVAVGDAVKAAKLRYFLEAPRFDPYDEKTLMQWTFFGLPMYAVDVGLAAGKSGASAAFTGAAPRPDEIAPAETFGKVKVERRFSGPGGFGKSALPAYLTRLQLHFDLTAPGVYTKYNASGDVLADGPGCPAPQPGEPEGCYYTLNGLVERGTGITDHPIQPYFIFDSRLAGTSQHGVLWMGGTYDEESGWVPVFAELTSNGGDGSDHGVAPRMRRSRPNGPRFVPGEDPPGCRPSDLEVNSLVVTTGDSFQPAPADPADSVERLYREVDMEIFYFNDTADSSQNCDRDGPRLEPGPFAGEYHQVSATTVEWAVPAVDESGVWRVVVVYSDATVDSEGRGRWIPLELTDDSGTFRGSLTLDASTHVTYMVQAMDRRGNVTWLEFVTTELPSSGVPLGLPEAVEVAVPSGLPEPLFEDGFESGDTSRWSQAVR